MRRIVFVLIPIVLMCSTLLYTLQRIPAVRTTGIVTRMVVAADCSDDSDYCGYTRVLTATDDGGFITKTGVDACYGHDNCSHTATVSFVADNGQSYEFTVGNPLPGVSVGEQVSVVYAANNPQDASLGSFINLWFPPLFWAWIAIFLFILPFASAHFERYYLSQRKAELRRMGWNLE